VNIVWADMLMDVGQVMFRRVVAQVFLPRLVIKFEVRLGNAIQQPEVTHFHCTGTLAFDSFVDDADSGSVIDMYRCR
jgi:hypothetical protein